MRPFLLINKGVELLQRHPTIETMTLCWSSALESSRPPNRSSSLPVTGARRVLASNNDTFCEPSHHPCNPPLIHPGRLVPVIIEVEGVSRVLATWLCPPLGYSFIESPKKWHFRS